MEQTLKKITEEQLNQLRQVEGYNDEEIEFFYTILNFNFGDGEILPFNHILNIFQKKMFLPNSFKGTEPAENYLGYYIDTYRILGLLSEENDVDTEQLLNIEANELILFHDELVLDLNQKGLEVNDILNDKYENSVSSFKKYNYENDNYKVGLIENLKELDWEGHYMNHCIATYRNIIADGSYIGFKFFNKISWERLTLGCHRKDDILIFDQFKAHSNYSASKESCEMIVEFCKKNKIILDLNNSYDLRILQEETEQL